MDWIAHSRPRGRRCECGNLSHEVARNDKGRCMAALGPDALPVRLGLQRVLVNPVAGEIENVGDRIVF